MDYILGLPLNFPPGSQYQYSNDGYTLLGAIVGQVCELSYHDYVCQRIFRPFGMTDSDFYTGAQWRADRCLARFAERTFDDATRRVHGGTPGVSGDMVWFAESDVLAVILSNYDNAAAPLITKLQELVK